MYPVTCPYFCGIGVCVDKDVDLWMRAEGALLLYALSKRAYNVEQDFIELSCSRAKFDLYLFL